jgi:hypothetical protein
VAAPRDSAASAALGAVDHDLIAFPTTGAERGPSMPRTSILDGVASAGADAAHRGRQKRSAGLRGQRPLRGEPTWWIAVAARRRSTTVGDQQRDLAGSRTPILTGFRASS